MYLLRGAAPHAFAAAAPLLALRHYSSSSTWASSDSTTEIATGTVAVEGGSAVDETAKLFVKGRMHDVVLFPDLTVGAVVRRDQILEEDRAAVQVVELAVDLGAARLAEVAVLGGLAAHVVHRQVVVTLGDNDVVISVSAELGVPECASANRASLVSNGLASVRNEQRA